MRIVGGDFKGRSLVAPSGVQTRPTADAQREAICNILFNGLHHESKRVLDLFAGTGALGLEAMSWGAEKVVFVESDRKALDCLHRNLNTCGVTSSQFSIVNTPKMDRWPKELALLGVDFLPFDTVFCDPPYAKGLAQKSLIALEDAASKLFLSPACVLVLELSSQEERPRIPENWEFFKDRTKGSTQLLFYRRR